MDRLRLFAAFAFIQTFLTACFCVLLLAVPRWGVLGILTGQIAASVIVLVLLITALRQDLGRPVWSISMRRAVIVSLPLACASLIVAGGNALNRFLAARHSGLEEFATYALALKTVAIGRMVASSFRSAWLPHSMRAVSHKDRERFYSRTFLLVSATLLSVAAAMTLFAEPIVAVLGPPKYASAALYVPFLASWTAVTTCTVVLNIGNQVERTTHRYALVSLVATFVNVCVTMLGLSSLDLLAPTLGFCAGGLTAFVGVYVSVRRYRLVRVPLSSWIVLASGHAAILLYGLHAWFAGPDTLVAVLITAFALACAWRTIDDHDRRRLRAILLNRFLRRKRE